MNRIRILISIAMTAIILSAKASYKDATLPVEQRVEDLLSRMTLEEKVAQLQGYFIRDSLAFDAEGNFVGVRDTAIMNRGAGSMYARGFWGDRRRRIQCINGIQKYMLDKSRLGVPVFVFGEALHGFMADGATSFPQAVALGCTWDTVLVEKVFTAAALEASARGTRQVLSPVLDLARDPRWGRTEECYGEDPYLVSRIGMAAVLGFQGRGKAIDKHHVAVTLKHFAGHGQSEGGRNIAPVVFGDREFRENHLYPFEMAFKRAHARSIMASYNEWDGVPNHVNRKLLWDILRKDWGFDGYVMSDGGGLDVTIHEHRAAADSAESGMLSVKAGVDYDLGGGGCFTALSDQVRNGLVPMEAVDRAAGNILRVKFELGLFEDPYQDPDFMEKVTDSAEHRALALKAAHEAAVLIKNENNTLPFDPAKIKTLAVIGPNAKGVHLGGYSATPHKGVDVLKGIEDFARGKFKVIYAQGCGLTLNPECDWRVPGNPILSDPKEDQKLIAEAVETAGKSDAVVLVLGENELICREAWSENHLGDRDDLDLVGMQNELAKAVIGTGKPVAVLLFNGRPITINELQKIAPAILECWYLGQETGPAAADLLFGKVNPSGKLTVTFPRSVGQLPCFYDRKPSRFRDYVLSDSSPLYPFGFGLSYTTFEYKNLKLTQTEIKPNGTVDVSVEVTNTGKTRGDEIVQLYIRDVISLPTRPVKELKDFARITLEPGETRTVTFTLTPEKLEAYDLDMKRTVQPGDFEIMVGKNSADVLKTTLTVKP